MTKAVLKDEFKDTRPDSQYPQWITYVGESDDHLRERMIQKGCDPTRYEWSTDEGVP